MRSFLSAFIVLTSIRGTERTAIRDRSATITASTSRSTHPDQAPQNIKKRGRALTGSSPTNKRYAKRSRSKTSGILVFFISSTF